MDEFTGMAFHSAEREVERLERQVDEARQEAAELRRQLEQERVEIGMLRRQLQEGEQSALSHAIGQIFYLRRQLAEAQAEIAEFVAMRAAANAAIAKAADLRQQVGEERMRANAAQVAVAQLRADATDLRRQVVRAGYEYREVQRALVEVGEATGADDPTSPESILDALADLRRQLEHANRWRDTAILEANEARAEAADLRRQLYEAQAWPERISIAAGADDATPAAILAALTELANF